MKTAAIVLLAAAFAVTLLFACKSEEEKPPATSGIEGQVLIGPMCPVVQEGTPCPDEPYQATIVIWNAERTKEIVTIETTADGRFRVPLPPGDYYVNATLRGGDAMIMDLALAAGGTPGPTGSSPRSGYAPTFFPGTTVPSDAQKITLAAGQEAQGTEFALAAVRLAKVSGVVINSEGKPVEGSMVSALPRNLRDFVADPEKRSYLDLAQRLSEISTEKLRALATALNDLLD